MPKYNTHQKLGAVGSYPLVKVKIRLPDGSDYLIVDALLDTGAAITVFPYSMIKDLADNSGGFIRKRAFGSSKEEAIRVKLDFVYGATKIDGVEVGLMDDNYHSVPLIGRNLLDMYHLFFDGKKGVWGVIHE